MSEQWRDIRGYEGLYQISNLGRVKNLCSDKVLKITINRNGYCMVGLRKNSKTKLYQLHRLVAEAFIPNPDNLPQVNHKDENKQNPYADNLEWCTAKYNSTYGTGAKRSAEAKCIPIVQKDLDGNVIKIWESATHAKRAGFSQGDIWLCIRGKRLTHKGCKWELSV